MEVLVNEEMVGDTDSKGGGEAHILSQDEGDMVVTDQTTMAQTIMEE